VAATYNGIAFTLPTGAIPGGLEGRVIFLDQNHNAAPRPAGALHDYRYTACTSSSGWPRHYRIGAGSASPDSSSPRRPRVLT
jgi:hypothetical protein